MISVRLRTILLIAGALIPSLLAAQPRTYHTKLYDSLDPHVLGSPWNYSSLTGYVAPDGQEYALLGSYTGTHIIELTTKPLQEIAFIPGPHSGWRELKARGKYAYIVSEGGGGLQIVEVSRLPSSSLNVTNDTSVFQTAHTIDLEGDYLYINGTRAEAGANGGTLIYSIAADPGHPVLVGKWAGRYVHDAGIRNDTLYAAGINDGVLDVIYLGKDRTNPVQVAEITYPGAGTHNADVTSDGHYILTTDEINTTPKTLKVWDRSDIQDITQVADYTPAPGEVIHNVHTKGKLAVIAWYTAGTRIIDMTDPLDPAEVGYFDEYSGPNGGYNGNWEVYPYLPSGKIIASDMQTGLYVFTFDGTGRGEVHGTVRDAATNAPIPHATVQFPDIGRTIQADDSGRYHYAGAAEPLTYRASATDYASASGQVVLTGPGDGTQKDILLNGLELADIQVSVLDDGTGLPLTDFAYRVFDRPAMEAKASANPQDIRLPKDSSFSVRVGAWGYIPQTVHLDRSATETISVRLKRGYYDDAELDLGWSLGAPDDNATSGEWERGIPVETTGRAPSGTIIGQPAEDLTADPGDHVFMTGLANSTDLGTNDVDDGKVTLTSPMFDLTGYTDPYISFGLWYINSNGVPNTVDDTLLIMISSDSAKSWKTIRRLDTEFGAWGLLSLRVRDSVNLTSQMFFRIVASDRNQSSLVEAGLDEFKIAEKGSAGTGGEEAQANGLNVIVRPNPISSNGVIDVTVREAHQQARLELFDLLGRHVATLHDGPIRSGETLYTVDAARLTPGGYEWRMTLDNGPIRSGSLIVVR